jgi:hypothetical protein
MILSEFKHYLKIVSEVTFLKPNGNKIPKHFHITEVGQTSKKFIDCGGTVRNEEVISMQLWESVDFLHRLEPSKLNSIIELSEKKLEIGNYEIEMEYQGETIEKYGVVFMNGVFQLRSTNTACLALDKCGIPSLENSKEKVQQDCTPGGGCC